MSIRLPILDNRDFVFSGPSGLCSYRASSGERAAELHLPGPNGVNIKLVPDGERLQISVDGTFIAAVEDFDSLPTQLGAFLIDHYHATLRAATTSREAAVQAALHGFEPPRPGSGRTA